MKTAIFLSIRDKATRLPKKVLLPIKEKTVTEHLIDRLKVAKLPDMIVLCTSIHPDDMVLVEIAKKNKISYFRGSEDDKLDRYYHAAIKYGIDFMVIVDGDDLFCDPLFIDDIIRTFQKTQADYIVYNNLPVGITGFGVKRDALKKVLDMKDEVDTEVWGGYFTNTGLFKVIKLEPKAEYRHPEIRMTLDYIEDFRFFEEIFDRLYKPGKVFSFQEIMTLLKDNPQILRINGGVQQKYLEKIKEAQKKVKLKQVKP
jgi:spore coat polysaccharide biosynthesis protein SpsF (cytidylyltransferase family)